MKKGDIINFDDISIEIIECIADQKYRIKFLKTGGITIAKQSNIITCKVKDPMRKTVMGIACLGNEYTKLKSNDKELIIELYKLWSHMLDRCHNEKNKMYKYYGGSGVKVCSSWLNFSTFIMDCMELEGFNRDDIIYKKLNLDKDKLQIDSPKHKRVYSKDTCVFITKQENMKLCDHSNKTNKHRNKPIMVIHSDKIKSHYPSAVDAAKFLKSLGLCPAHIASCAKGKRKSHKGLKFEYYS